MGTYNNFIPEFTQNQILPPTAPVDYNGQQLEDLGTPDEPTDAATAGYIDNKRLNEFVVPNGSIDVNNQYLNNVKSPILDGDGTNKLYVDSVSGGFIAKTECLVASTSEITFLDFRTTQVDGVTLATGNRVLVKNQSNQITNGVYDASTTGSWTRSSDSDTTSKILHALYFITSGDELSYSSWTITGSPTINVDPIIFAKTSQSGSISAGVGLNKSGNTLSAIGTSDRISVGSNGIDISNTYAGQNTITTVGTVTQGSWHGNTIGILYGGTGSTTVSGAAQSLGQIFSNPTNVSIAQTITSNDRGKFYNTDCTISNITHIIPTAVSVGNGFVVSFRKSDNGINSIIVSRSGSDTINGLTTATLTYQNQTMSLVSNGVDGWYIAQRGQRNPTPIGEGGTGVDLSLTGGTGNFIKQKTIGGNFSVESISASELPNGIDSLKISTGIIDNTTFNYLHNTTSNIQGQLNNKIEATNALLSIK